MYSVLGNGMIRQTFSSGWSQEEIKIIINDLHLAWEYLTESDVTLSGGDWGVILSLSLSLLIMRKLESTVTLLIELIFKENSQGRFLFI